MPSYNRNYGKRKRTYGPSGARRFKRRRMGVRRRRNATRNTAFTTQAGRSNAFGFRTKRIGRRTWRRQLWNSTTMKTHYRTYLAQSNAFATSANAALATVFYYPTIEFGARFWTPAGGAVGVDTAVAVPTFQDDIILRGGVISLTIGNVDEDPSRQDDLWVRVWLIQSDQTPGIGATVPPNGLGGVSTTFSRDWDPSVVADSHKEFAKRILLSRSVQVANGQSLVLRHRLGIQKIDQEDYLDDNNKLFWVIAVADNVNSSANNFQCTASYNMSFSGDAI